MRSIEAWQQLCNVRRCLDPGCLRQIAQQSAFGDDLAMLLAAAVDRDDAMREEGPLIDDVTAVGAHSAGGSPESAATGAPPRRGRSGRARWRRHARRARPCAASRG